jgi:hypothetical protein
VISRLELPQLARRSLSAGAQQPITDNEVLSQRRRVLFATRLIEGPCVRRCDKVEIRAIVPVMEKFFSGHGWLLS